MNPDNDEYEDVRITAKLDQVEGAMGNIAQLVIAYYKALLREGAPEELAAALTLQYQQRILEGVKK